MLDFILRLRSSFGTRRGEEVDHGTIRRFFARHAITRKKDRARGPIAGGYGLVGERLAQLFDRDVGRFFEEGQDRVLVRLDPCGSAISAL
jgi:hypothetical protein